MLTAIRFIGTSSYKYAWKFLLMPTTATLDDFEKRAAKICSMSYTAVQEYVTKHKLMLDDSTHYMEFLPYYCFMNSYNLVMLKGQDDDERNHDDDGIDYDDNDDEHDDDELFLMSMMC